MPFMRWDAASPPNPPFGHKVAKVYATEAEKTDSFFCDWKITEQDLGHLLSEFSAFHPHPNHNPKRKKVNAETWPIVEVRGPPIPDLPAFIQRMIDTTWKVTEPKARIQRGAAGWDENKPLTGFIAGPAPRNDDGTLRHGPLTIGTRGTPPQMPRSLAKVFANPNDGYHPQIRPSPKVLETKMGNERTPIASDWFVFKELQRVNAVSFRGDTRSPAEVILNCKGFFPPDTRTDQYYIENAVYNGFNDYMTQRFNRTIDKNDFLYVVNWVATSPEDRQLLCDYEVWRQLMRTEAAHMGRMVEYELLKGYISTGRSMDSSMLFGSGLGNRPGWLYLVITHGGFVVPYDSTKKVNWGTQEAEIAQLGPIPAERIVGFTRLDKAPADLSYHPVGPIFIRRKFRKAEPEACTTMYEYMSGKTP